MHEKKRIAVFGAGGIGGVVGGMLSKDEHDVTFIDTWYEHINEIQNIKGRVIDDKFIKSKGLQ